jgi:pyrimidine deaminase RibD-like protein
MWSDFEREVMEQAVEEAKRGRPSPNPRVGAAIRSRWEAPLRGASRAGW